MIINFYGPAGSGKSTVAPLIYAHLKRENCKVELVREKSIKDWAYEGKKPHLWFQPTIFGEQLYEIESKLVCGVDHIVTDSPIVMQCAYTKKYNSPVHEEILSIAKKFHDRYRSCDIYLDRGKIPYQKLGRYEDYEEAIAMDKFMLPFLQEHVNGLRVVDTANWDLIMDIVFKELDICQQKS